MLETEEQKEMLSQEEINKEVGELLRQLDLYNNLNKSILGGEHYMLPTMRSALAQEKASEGEEVEYFTDLIAVHESFSNDLKRAMTQVGLKQEDVVAYHDINERDRWKYEDLVVLRDYFRKIRQVYDILEQNWSQEVMGTIFEKESN